jgi:hypothetical protein
MKTVNALFNKGGAAVFRPDAEDDNEVNLELLKKMGLILIVQKQQTWILVLPRTNRWLMKVKAVDEDTIRVSFKPSEAYEIDVVKSQLGLSATERDGVSPNPAASGILVDIKPPFSVHTARDSIVKQLLKVKVGEIVRAGTPAVREDVFREYTSFTFSFTREDENFSSDV